MPCADITRNIQADSSLRGADGKQREVVMSDKEQPAFESGSLVIIAADAALAATSNALKGATDDKWFRQKLIKAALEAALASVIFDL